MGLPANSRGNPSLEKSVSAEAMSRLRERQRQIPMVKG